MAQSVIVLTLWVVAALSLWSNAGAWRWYHYIFSFVCFYWI